ncbi:MAG TPA: hypothetical protein VMF31_10060 [Solirubrobacterales bacterium]|nr:hypothetical protein [Solirubrobacterales bacterium]
MLATGLCMGFAIVAADRLNLLKYRMDFGDWMAYLGYFLAVGFVVMLVLNPLFKRKSRPWRNLFSVPPEDRWPRG